LWVSGRLNTLHTKGGTVMNVTLTLEPREAEVLKRVLAGYLGDLRMEVSGTDSYEYREDLKADELAIKGVLMKLGVERAFGVVA